jgi:hypothetical protein
LSPRHARNAKYFGSHEDTKTPSGQFFTRAQRYQNIGIYI